MLRCLLQLGSLELFPCRFFGVTVMRNWSSGHSLWSLLVIILVIVATGADVAGCHGDEGTLPAACGLGSGSQLGQRARQDIRPTGARDSYGIDVAKYH